MFLEGMIVRETSLAISSSLDCVIDMPGQISLKVWKDMLRKEESFRTELPFDILMDNSFGEWPVRPVTAVCLPIVKVSADQVIDVPFHREVRAYGTRGVSNLR